jgi:hypothetical protein
MAWVIDSNKLSNSMFQALHWRLLISYLSVMVAILGTFTVAVYQFVAYNLYQKTDRQMLGLADAAAHSLTKIQADRTAIYRQMPRSLDDDGDLDIPWQDLREKHQSVEWYDANCQLLGKAGKPLQDIPLAANSYISQQGQIRALTIRVYEEKQSGTKQELQGYIRVLESTEELAEELDRLLLGLGVAGIIALSLTSVGGLWLTRQSLQPIQLSFQQLKQVNQQLKQFTADASHELRSPLTAIKTSTQVMMTHPERIHPADVDKLDAIASATGQMTRLVEDLLLLARTDATGNTPTVEWRSIPIDELLEDLVDFLSPQAQAKEITLKLDLSEEVFVKGDAAQLKRLFSNLLENALQYTPSGGTVTVSIASQDQFIVISVEDTGIGIVPEHIPLVFHRFWRADKARSHRTEGSGLGLAIAQAIAQRHAGEITVSSQVGVGSCFGVHLPIAALA